jgi:hypothetical protein
MDGSDNASASATANLSLTTGIMVPSFTAVSSAAHSSAVDDSDSDSESVATLDTGLENELGDEDYLDPAGLRLLQHWILQ